MRAVCLPNRLAIGDPPQQGHCRVGEIIGDQDLHEAGKAEAERGREEQDKPSDRNPLKKLNQLT